MLRQREARCVAPQIFERVKGAFFLMKNVDDHIRIIRDHPLAQREAVDARRADAVLLAQAVFEFAHERLQMRLRVPRADEEKIRETRDAAHVEGDDVLGFFVSEDYGTELGEVF